MPNSTTRRHHRKPGLLSRRARRRGAARTCSRSSATRTSSRSCSTRTRPSSARSRRWQHAKACADLFRGNRDRIDGVLVCLPNFGDEKGVADTLKLAGAERAGAGAGLSGRSGSAARRHAGATRSAARSRSATTCAQYGIRFQPDRATHGPPGVRPEFRRGPGQKFLGVCRVVSGLRGARIGAIGARPNAFNTTRYSEKLLAGGRHQRQHARPVGSARRGAPTRPTTTRASRRSSPRSAAMPRRPSVPNAALCQMAKLGVVVLGVDGRQLDLDATAIQCWSSLQQNYGVQRAARS